MDSYLLRRSSAALVSAAMAATGLALASPTAHAAPTTAAVPLSAFSPSFDAGARIPGFAEYLATGPNASTDGSVIGPDYTPGHPGQRGGRPRGGAAHRARPVRPVHAGPDRERHRRRLRAAAGRLRHAVGLRQREQAAPRARADLGVQLHQHAGHLRQPDPPLLQRRADCCSAASCAPATRCGSRSTRRTPPCPYTINLADFYQVAAPRSGSRRTRSRCSAEGADPTGATDSTAAFDGGDRRRGGRARVGVDPGRATSPSTRRCRSTAATIEGAGRLVLPDPLERVHRQHGGGPGPGQPERTSPSSAARSAGTTTAPHNAINGSLGTGAVVDGLWIQNTNVGLWLEYGNTDVTVTEQRDPRHRRRRPEPQRQRHRRHRHATTSSATPATTAWPSGPTRRPTPHDTFACNTVEQPNLANGIAEYGGTDNTIIGNVIADTNALGSGLTISNEQFASPGFTTLAGTITVVAQHA